MEGSIEAFWGGRRFQGTVLRLRLFKENLEGQTKRDKRSQIRSFSQISDLC